MTAGARAWTWHGWLWLALMLGAIASLPIDTGDIVIVNFSPFDVIVLAAAGFVILRVGWPRHLTRTAWTCLTFIAFLAAHTAILASVASGFDLDWAIRELVKSSAIIAFYLFLRIIFDGLRMDFPDRRVSLAVVLLGLALFLVYHLQETSGRNYVVFFPRTTFVAGLWTFTLFYVCRIDWRSDLRDFAKALGLTFVVSITCLVALSKLGTAIGGCFAVALVWGWLTFPARSRAERRWIFVAVGVLAGLSVVTILGLFQGGVLDRLDSVSRSAGVRSDLWGASLWGVLQNFGAGVGLGQFGQLFGQIPELAVQNHRFPHSVFFSFATQIGILGVILFCGLLVLLWRALSGLGKEALLPALAFMVPLIVFHDIHGARALILLVAFGASLYYRDQQGVNTGF